MTCSSQLERRFTFQLQVAAICCVVAFCMASFVGCGKPPLPRQNLNQTNGSVTIHGDVWADNWFALYLGDQLLIEDSVPITTERSFNAESFTFKADYPIVLNFVVKDFKEDDSGLEYIGTPRQQLGDGGMIAQFTDATTGKLLAASSSQWRCKVLHHGPVEESCADESSPVAGEGPCGFVVTDEPDNWKSPDYTASDWETATEHSHSAVRPKDGYDQVSWNSQARLIWGKDLKKDNTILLRVVIEGP
jgi:hypothetical protein